MSECPLDDHLVDVAVVARTGAAMETSERGALCAARRRIPVVLTGDPRNAVSFGPGTHLAGVDLLGTVQHAAASGVAHAAAVRRALVIDGHLRPVEIDGPHAQWGVSVSREPGRLRLVVTAPEGDRRLPGIVKAGQEAVRRFDQHVSVIDVVVRHP